MVSSTACATMPSWKRVAVITQAPSHRDGHAPMRAGSPPAAGGLDMFCGRARLLLRAVSTPAVGEREHAGSVFRRDATRHWGVAHRRCGLLVARAGRPAGRLTIAASLSPSEARKGKPSV